MSAIEARQADAAQGGNTTLPSSQRHDRIPPSRSLGDDDEGVEVDISGAQKMLSAVSGSLLTSLLVTPLDVVRVRLQSQPNPSPFAVAKASSPASFNNLPTNLGVTACCREVFWVNNNAQFCVAAPSPSSFAPEAETLATECAVEETQRRTFTSTLDGLRKIARHEGFSSLWRGLSPTLVMAVPANVIYFAGYDWLRYNRRSPLNDRISDRYAPLLAGSVARISAATVISPIEMFRTRLQASSSGRRSKEIGTKSPFVDTLKGLNELVHAQGYSSLWRGLTLTLWRDVPFSGLYWWGYEAVRNLLTDYRRRSRGDTTHPPDSIISSRTRRKSENKENHSVILADSFIAGATSGAISAFVTTPFDVGKTRQQVYKHGDHPSATSKGGSSTTQLRPEQRSMPRFLWYIFQHEGAAGLWRGWAARCLKVAPACAIMISSYELGKKMARGMNEKREAHA
ncbi:MAG: hypothetical protein M1817_002168 [Caeruleum heppii]|nr:MAG: hypothetical protein M1817_002168 [Caeruleum heppii]